MRASIRNFVCERAGGICEYCLSASLYSPTDFEVEHIISKYAGGTDDPDNLAFACGTCNDRKQRRISAVDPKSGETAPFYHPRRDNWDDHFRWSDEGSKIVGISPTGRATVAALMLNRPSVIRFREVLKSVGLHPPRIGEKRVDSAE